MRIVKYKKTEFLMPWKFSKKNSLYRFILDIPYGLYFSVVPSFCAINEVLLKGSAGGGMGTGLIWGAFDITKPEYDEVLEVWKTFDLRTVHKFKPSDIPDLSFIFDDEIMAIPHHLDYLSKSREKYAAKFWKNRQKLNT